MKLENYIEKGIEKTGSGAELARQLDIASTNIFNAKAGQRGLPSYVCVKLAEIIDADPLEVIAASELVTEKKEERKEIWKRVLDMKHAAALVIFVIVTGFMTPVDVKASSDVIASETNLYYVKLSVVVKTAYRSNPAMRGIAGSLDSPSGNTLPNCEKHDCEDIRH